jgi:enamine deaminase RidA (YjgF/YER057c/UK114 family)
VNEGEIEAGLAPTSGYRYAERAGDRLLVAGQVPHDGDANLVGPGNPSAQAAQCLDNLRTLVTHHGFVVADIRQLTIYVVGPHHHHLLAAWEAVVRWFGGDVPPATLLGVSLLGHRHQLVEIDATVTRSIDAS